MPRNPRFPIYRIKQGKKPLWRIWVPARFNSTGKDGYVYYQARYEAEEEQQKFLASYRGGTMGPVLPPASVKDAAKALDALKVAGIDMTLEQCAMMAIERMQARLAGATTREMMDRFRESVSTERNWSDKHAGSYRFYSSRFSDRFGDVLACDLDPQAIKAWLLETFPSVTYYNSALAVISSAFTWAVRQEFLSASPFDKLERRKEEAKDDIDVFTPEEARRLLRACVSYKDRAGHPMGADVDPIYVLDCSDCLIPFAILLFAGIRPAELEKLPWENVRLDIGLIRITPSMAKTGDIRNVEIEPTLRDFLKLAPEHERFGMIVPKNWKRKARLVRLAAGLQNRADAARHSYASYWLAANNDVARLQSNMGHARGSNMLFKHYCSAVLPSAAKEYWAIAPEQ